MRKRYRSRRNHGWGRRIDHAGFNALQAAYGGGRYATIAAMIGRWRMFYRFCRDQGVTNLQKIDEQELLEDYAAYCCARVEDGDLKVSHAHNLISAANVTFSEIRGDDDVRVSPAEWVGKRSYVREDVPGALKKEKVNAVVADLVKHDMKRAAVVFLLCRFFGVRREEAIKADLVRWKKESESRRVNVLDGTKGGRRANRLIQCGEEQKEALTFALKEKPAESRNLLRRDETYWEFAIARQSEINRARAILHRHGITGYHDARAAYACDRYRLLSGCDAPVVSNASVADQDTEAHARQQIAIELGHGRSSVVVAYLGARRKTL